MRPLLSLALLLVACRRDRSAEAKPLDELSANAVPAPPTAALSRFDVPLDYDFSDLLDVVERVVPKTYGSLDVRKQIGDDTRKHYAFVATRGPFTAYAHDDEVFLRATISYAARGFYKTPLGPTLSAGCGNDSIRPELVVELVTKLDLTADWRLKSNARVGQVSSSSDSAQHRCRVSVLKLDVTDKVIEAARDALTANLKKIDARIAKVNFRKKAANWWGHLNKPIRLNDQAWLLLQPQQLRLKGVSGEKQMLTIQAGLDAYPIIMVTNDQPTPVVPPLPPLSRDTGSTGFMVVVDGLLDYEAATTALNGELRGKIVTKSGRMVVVDSVRAFAARNGKLALAVSFTGDASGTLTLMGKPVYDRAQGRLRVPDLDYDLQTDSDLINTYAWLKSDDLLLMMREKAQLPVTAVLERGRVLIDKGLNRTIKGILRLAASVDSLDVKNVYVTSDGVVVRALATGDAKVVVRREAKDSVKAVLTSRQ